MSLDVDVQVRLGALQLDLSLVVHPGELVAVLGPNGSGKSTLLRCVAGLVPLDDGHVVVDGRPLDSPAGDVFVPPQQRSVGMVFQDYLLFDNLSALDNVAFGVRANGARRQPARRVAARWLDRVGLADLGHLRPRALSGGQAQRVALARALVTEPRVLLLDEPLAALDAGARATMRVELRRHLDSFDGMRLLVTHDPLDAYALADRVVVLEHGRIAQQGALGAITAHPRSRYVADLAGLSLVRGELRDGVLTTPGGLTITVAEPGHDGPAFVAIRPQAVSLHRHRPDGSARNVWHLHVADVDRRPERSRVGLDGQVPIVAEITTAALDELALAVGDPVWASVKATDIAAFGS